MNWDIGPGDLRNLFNEHVRDVQPEYPEDPGSFLDPKYTSRIIRQVLSVMRRQRSCFFLLFVTGADLGTKRRSRR